MLITGLDVASCTGVSWIDPAASPSTWRCLAVEAEGEEPWDKAADLAAALRLLLEANRPDLVVIERPLGVVVDYGSGRAPGKRMINAKTTITLAALAAAAVTTLEVERVPWCMIAPATWRAMYYGKGCRPDDWKDIAVDRARRLGVLLPHTKRAARDAAESVGIACAWSNANFIPAGHRAAFMQLRAGGRVAA